MFTPRVLEAAYSLHRGPTDHKRSVGQQVSSSEVHNQLFSFCSHSERDSCPGTMMKSLTSSKYAVSSLLEMMPRTTVSSANLIIDVDLERTRSHGVERVEQGAQDTTCGAPTVRVMEFEVYWPTFTT